MELLGMVVQTILITSDSIFKQETGRLPSLPRHRLLMKAMLLKLVLNKEYEPNKLSFQPPLCELVLTFSDAGFRKNFFIATVLSALVFCVMQMYRRWLSSSQLHTIIGGYLGSVLFTLLLTAVGNFEFLLCGPRFQSKLFPEVTICLAVAMMTCGMVHRVCTTTCFLFSMISLYYINKMSKQAYPLPSTSAPQPVKKKK